MTWDRTVSYEYSANIRYLRITADICTSNEIYVVIMYETLNAEPDA